MRRVHHLRPDILGGMDVDAVVIGAGAAGLAAARSLARRSMRVALLEARDRVGGRVWSRPLADAATPLELGAEFIHGPAGLTMRVLREARLAAIDTGGEGWSCSEGGDLRRDDGEWSSIERIVEATDGLAGDESVDQFLRRFEEDEAAREAAKATRFFVEGFDAADPSVASIRAFADEWLSGVDFAAARPVGGYQPMFDHLREACVAAGVQIRLATVVRRISWRRGFVAVDAIDANRRTALQTVHARTAIVTLPVGVLRHSGDETAVVFDPDLPGAKVEALRKIEMGHVIRVGLGFRTPFWERVHDGRYRDASFFRCERQVFPTHWTQMPLRSTLIIAWVGGPRAFRLRGISEADVMERALSSFGAALDAPELAHDEFEDGLMHDWSRDPFARGAYSYVTVGGAGARAALAAPLEDTVFFAGEATATGGQSGTVDGALETGERAAAEAAKSLAAGAR